MPPKRRTSGANGRAAQTRQEQPPKRPALSLLDTDDTDDKKLAAPKRPVKRARKTQAEPARTSIGHGQEPDDDEEEDEDDGGNVRQVQVANINRKRSKPRNAQPATVEEYLMEQNQQAKEFLKSFKAELLESQSQAEESLAEFKRELHNIQTNDEEDFRRVYATLKAATQDKTKNLKGIKEPNPLFTQGEQLTKICRDILQRHQLADRDSQQHKPTVPREIWAQDYQKMRQLLDYGRKYGEKMVEGIISPDVKSDDSPSKDGEKEGGLSEPETLAVGLFDNSKKKSAETETWGRVAHAQVKALAAVVRTVP
ncbi:hypothetical protein SMACR_02459 [Sordaria macrospora]|uniref:WGS project CABT00000000 data, contig 2.3 n=2 Tax=Sordaria macrospora TaxID=5147 RepID=F7VPM6_SORMK|nr:uncharacterized protein SMAC_02459 [Sordaria macrospora k-hell]KAA8632308.1 hypothetical protein SMACR_02459 [Sordaria macrospora]WPJ64847.1 hypothetical protein SMAC4_02459 [Sordaria macrospora]CCC07454.1 unnamed protein product [Sordaria macrospora k-hell]